MGSFNGLPARKPAAAMPAPKFAAAPHRRAMLAKVHVAKVQLGLVDDDYRAVLMRVAGCASAGDCTDAQLIAVLAEFAAKGFSASAKRTAARRADHPVARKARALWISLAHLGAIADPSERALEVFARRQLGCERMQWANQALGYKLVEALKAIAARHGWDQSVEGVAPGAVAVVLSRRLVDSLVDKLKAAELVPADWSVQRVAYDLAGVELASVFGQTEELHRLAAALGAKLREASK